MKKQYGSKLVSLIDSFKKEGICPYYRAIQSAPTATTVMYQNKKLIMLGSNNYLGLTHHPYVKNEAIEAIKKYGTGCTGSRFLSGNLDLHESLERRLAEFLGHEDCIIYPTGMQANLGSLSALVGTRDCAFSDMENHASIIDGLHRDRTFKFKHSNFENLETLLKEHRHKYQNALIVTDGVFSMSGEVADLNSLNLLATKYDCQLYVDDAHALGVLGFQGKGTGRFKGITPSYIMGTFSKSFAGQGGFLVGPKEVLKYVRLHARAFMFSASLTPATIATASACLDIIEVDSSFQSNLHINTQYMAKGLRDLGYKIPDKIETGIIPVFIESDKEAMRISKALEVLGVFVTPVISPATNSPIIRTSYSAAHSKDELNFCLDAFKKVM